MGDYFEGHGRHEGQSWFLTRWQHQSQKLATKHQKHQSVAGFSIKRNLLCFLPPLPLTCTHYLFLRFLDDFRDLDGERDRDCEPDLEEPELESDEDDDDDDELRELELELLLLEVECLRRFRDLYK
jgi:hypothetical protein